MDIRNFFHISEIGNNSMPLINMNIQQTQLRAQSGASVKITSILLALLGAGGSVQAQTTANLLGDSGFDLYPLQGFSTVLNDFVGQQGKWGSEVGTIVTGTSTQHVTPYSNPSMLSMTNADYGVTTQTAQVINLTGYAAEINSGTTTFDLRAMFTVGTSNIALKGFSGASAGVVAMFYTTPDYVNSHNTPYQMYSAPKILDEDPFTWELVSLHGTIPVGTTWMAVQVLYGDSSLATGEAGYVDSASLTLTAVPEPGNLLTLSGLVACAAFLRVRNRR